MLQPALLSVVTILLIVGMLAFDIPAVIAIPGHVDLMSIEIFRSDDAAVRLSRLRRAPRR